MQIFAINIKKYRLQHGYSQEKLAELAGLHRTYISAIEREQRNISIENIEKIATALNIDAYLLFQDSILEIKTMNEDNSRKAQAGSFSNASLAEQLKYLQEKKIISEFHKQKFGYPDEKKINLNVTM